MKRGIWLGAVVILVFSVWPVRTANTFCCFGVVLGGYLAATVTGKTQGAMIESTVGIRVGALAGLLASIAAVMLTLVGNWLWVDAPIFDAIPEVVYDFVYPLWDGIMDISAGSSTETSTGPGFLWRVLFQIPINALFGGFGGAIAASMFQKEPPLGEN